MPRPGSWVAEDSTPEIDTSEAIVDCRGVSQCIFSGIFQRILTFSVAFSKGFSHFQRDFLVDFHFCEFRCAIFCSEFRAMGLEPPKVSAWVARRWALTVNAKPPPRSAPAIQAKRAPQKCTKTRFREVLARKRLGTHGSKYGRSINQESGSSDGLTRANS